MAELQWTEQDRERERERERTSGKWHVADDWLNDAGFTLRLHWPDESEMKSC